MSKSMTTEQENLLTRELLEILYKIESPLQAGDCVLVQPYIEGMSTTNPISVPGYNWEQINSTLRVLCQRELISTGSVTNGALIGIYFSHLTPAGRRIIGR